MTYWYFGSVNRRQSESFYTEPRHTQNQDWARPENSAQVKIGQTVAQHYREKSCVYQPHLNLQTLKTQPLR